MTILNKDSIQEIIISEYEKSQKNIQSVWLGEGWYKGSPNSFNYFASGFEAGMEFSQQQIDDTLIKDSVIDMRSNSINFDKIMNKSTYIGEHFAVHLLESDGKITISLSSEYVHPPVEKHELVQLCDFIKKYLESTNALERN